MRNPFVSLYLFLHKSKGLVWISMLLLFGALGFGALRLGFNQDISQILPQKKQLEGFQEILGKDKVADPLAFTFQWEKEKADPDGIVEAITFWETSWNQLPSSLANVDSHVNDSLANQTFGLVWKNLPFLFEAKDTLTWDSLCRPASIDVAIQKVVHHLNAPSGMATKGFLLQDPLGIAGPVFKKIQSLRKDDAFSLYQGYYFTSDKKNALFFIQPKFNNQNTKQGAVLIEQIEAINSATIQKFPGLKITYFGGVAVAVANAKQVKSDITLTVSLTVIGLLLVFWLFLRSYWSPIVLVLPVVFGLGVAFTFIGMVQSEISIIALAAASVVLGIGIDFSIHFYTHFYEERNMESTLKELTIPLTLGCFTTVAAFFALTFLDNPILHDFGLVSGCSIIGTALFCLVFMPHLVPIFPPSPTIKTSAPWVMLTKLTQVAWDRKKVFVAGLFIFTGIALYFAPRVGFESDLLRLNFMPQDLATAETKLNQLTSSTQRTVILVEKAKTLAELKQKTATLYRLLENEKKEGTIGSFRHPFQLLPSPEVQAQNQNIWRKFWSPKRISQVKISLQTSAKAAGLEPNAFDSFIQNFEKANSVMDAGDEAALLSIFYPKSYKKDAEGYALWTQAKVPLEQRAGFFTQVEKNPAVLILDKQYFTTQLLDLVNKDFQWIAGVSSLLVFITLWISYGRIELALVTFLPMAISWIWILGIMALVGIPFNMVNIILSTFVFGLGDDYSIFVTDGLIQENATGRKTLAITKNAVFLSALTTIIGLGVLIFAQHPALKSIALISIIGMVCVVVSSYTLIPFFFRILISDRSAAGKRPYTFKSLLVTLFTYGYFLIGCIFMNLIAFLVALWPRKNNSPHPWLTWLMFFTCRFLTKGTFTVKKSTHGWTSDLLQKPKIIIANHQSFLDILFTISLHPKIVLVTNDWVWQSPFFGFVIRKAGYIPASMQLEERWQELKAKTDAGYSIVIFPEGTRSTDGQVHRFHKGAFFLGEKLQMDVLPLVILGTGDVVAKKDPFMVNDGHIQLTFLPVISHQNSDWGLTYQERTKTISSYFKKEYGSLKLQHETPGYFHQRVHANYVYKGPVLEWYVRVKLWLEGNYALFHDLLPTKGRIVDIGCGYGYMDYMLWHLAPQRILIAIDHDAEKIEIAGHCFAKNENIQFLAVDTVTFELPEAEAFVLSDVLHYLPAESQFDLIQKCVQKIHPGGKIVIRDGDSDLAERHEGTKWTEFFSTRSGFNKTMEDTELQFISGTWLAKTAEALDCSFRKIDNSKRTSNVFYVLEKKLP